MKPKCPKCGKRQIGRWSSSDVTCRACGWTKRVSSAAIIRLAVEPKKPETCKWKKFRGARTADTKCGTWRNTLADKFCGKCGKPVEVVNG